MVDQYEELNLDVGKDEYIALSTQPVTQVFFQSLQLLVQDKVVGLVNTAGLDPLRDCAARGYIAGLNEVFDWRPKFDMGEDDQEQIEDEYEYA